MNFPKFGKSKRQKALQKRGAALPRYVNMKPRVDNSKVLAQAKKRRFRTRLEGAGVLERLKGLKIVRVFLGVIIISAIAGLIIFLRTTTLFDVKEIGIIVDKQPNYAIVEEILEEYRNRNVFLISAAEVEEKIKERIPSVNTIFVNKSLSGILNVEVIEDSPIYYLANSNGIYLINQDGEVMEVIEPEVKLELSETEQLIKDNKLPADSDQVRLKYMERFETEEEKSQVIWKDVPEEEKEAVLNQMKESINAKIADFNNRLQDQVKSDRFRDLVGSYIVADTKYSVGDQIPLENLNFLSLVQDFFKSKNIGIWKSTWTSDYTLEVQLDGNPTVLFSVKRSYTEQFEDLNTLIYYGQFNGARIVDVRSSNYSVIR